MNKFIPKDYIRIAESEFLNGKAEVYWNKERQMLLLVINDLPMGYIKPHELEYVIHCLKDVHEMRGRYGEV